MWVVALTIMNSGDCIYYGETECDGFVKSKGTKCTNKAYFISGGKYWCGVHKGTLKMNVCELPQNPRKLEIKQNELNERKKEVEEMALKNRENGIKGNVMVSKLFMMKSPEYYAGYLNVFPNYKHQNRKDGFGCMRLSPKSLGPVVHNMPHLPEATTIENFHQFAKFWEFELDENKQILEQYKQERIKAYTGPPMRHKYDKKTLMQINGNVNVPAFSMYYDQAENEHRYNYLQCRYFYCHFYERLVRLEPDFVQLKQWIVDGYNLNICGYDGFQVTQTLMQHYRDISRPFGHELVLYTMLVEDDSACYPWNMYYEENKEIYEGVI